MFKVIPIAALAVVVGGQRTEASGEHEVPSKYKTDPKRYFEELGQHLLPDLQAIEEGYSFRQSPGFSVGVNKSGDRYMNSGSVIPQLADPVVTWEIWQSAMNDRKRQMGSELDQDPTTLVPRATEAFRKTMLQVRDGIAAHEQIKEASTYMAASVDHMMAHLGLDLPNEVKADFLSRIAAHWDEEASKLALLGAKKDAVLATQSTASLIAAMAKSYAASPVESDLKVTLEFSKEGNRKTKSEDDDIYAAPPRFAQVPAGSRAPPKPVKKTASSERDREMLDKQRASLKARDSAKREADEAFIRATLSQADALTYTGEGPAGLSMGLFTAGGAYAQPSSQKNNRKTQKKVLAGESDGVKMVDGSIDPALTAELLASTHAPPVIEGVPHRVFEEDATVSEVPLASIHNTPSRTEPSFQEMAALQERLAGPIVDKFSPFSANSVNHVQAEELVVAPHEIDNELLEVFGGVADIADVSSEVVMAFMQRHTAHMEKKKKTKRSGGDFVEVVHVGLTDDSAYDAQESVPTTTPKRLRSSPSFRQNKLTIVQLPSKQQLKEREASRQVKAKQVVPFPEETGGSAVGVSSTLSKLFSTSFLQTTGDVFEINKANNNLSLKEQNERILAYVENDGDI